MTFPENGTRSQIPEPAQVSYIRKHASYLLVGRLADRLFDAGWFFVGLVANLVVVLPYMIVLALFLGRFHFEIVEKWHWAILIEAAFVFLSILFVTQLRERRFTSNTWVANVSRVIGGMVLAFGISVALISANLAVEYFRDQFRFNEISLISALGSSGAILGAIGLLQSIIPERLRTNHLFLALAVSMAGAAAVFLLFVLLLNWIVYGNSLEVANSIELLKAWSFVQIGLLAICLAVMFVGTGWLYRNWLEIRGGKEKRNELFVSLFQNGSLLSQHNFFYIAPLAVTCMLLFPYAKAEQSLGGESTAVSMGIGKVSRGLNVFAEIGPEETKKISHHTKQIIDYLRSQRNQIRRRQEYRPENEDGGFDDLGRAHIETFGVTQSYVDNAVEIYELDASEKFLLRQTIAEKSRQRLLKRANVALGQASRELNPESRWALVKPTLVEQATLRVLNGSNLFLSDSLDDIDVVESQLVSRLVELKVNALYQREFTDLFCPSLADRVPTPASVTSSFPGTMPVFFDGINPESRVFVQRALGRWLLRKYGASNQRFLAFSNAFERVVPQIIEEEELRASISGKTDNELIALCEAAPVSVPKVEVPRDPSPKSDSDSRPVLRIKSSVVPLTNDFSTLDLGIEWCSIAEQLGIYAASWTSDTKPTQADIAREILIERAKSTENDSVESLRMLQAPEILPSDAAETQRRKYARRGTEQFAPRELIQIVVAPFLGGELSPNLKDQVAGSQQIDLVASTVAYSDYANLEKLSQTRKSLFVQAFGLKGLLVSLAALLLGSGAVGWVNVNRTTANEYYRSKLHKTFLTEEGGATLDRRLSDLNVPSSKAPYLLINTAVNLHGSKDLALRDRKCDLFLFSPLHVGSRLTKYVNTKRLEEADPNFHLSNAVAISAAAIAPNMGRFTSPLLAWILSLLNIRLGYWIPNPTELDRCSNSTLDELRARELKEYIKPRRGIPESSDKELDLIGLAFPGGGIRSATFNLGVAQLLAEFHLLSTCDYLSTVSGGGYIGSSLITQILEASGETSEPATNPDSTESNAGVGRSWNPPPALLFTEMLSVLREKDAWLNLSDGGHIENLAVFELLERRCRLIVVGNAEAGITNPNNGIGILQRMAKTDLGIEIDIDSSGFDLNPNLYCRSHWSVGRIKYADDSVGRIVMLRASLTGDEEVAITEYKERNPLFPFESTVDQFFDVGQFEAYRLLGMHVTRDFLESVFPDAKPNGDLPLEERCALFNRTIQDSYPIKTP